MKENPVFTTLTDTCPAGLPIHSILLLKKHRAMPFTAIADSNAHSSPTHVIIFASRRHRVLHLEQFAGLGELFGPVF